MKFNWIFSQFWLYIYYKLLSGQLKIIIKFKIPFIIMWLKTINYIHHHINLWATCSKSCSTITILQYWMIMCFFFLKRKKEKKKIITGLKKKNQKRRLCIIFFHLQRTPKYYNYKNSTQLKIINNLGQNFFFNALIFESY